MRGFFGCRILGTDRLAAGLFVWTVTKKRQKMVKELEEPK